MEQVPGREYFPAISVQGQILPMTTAGGDKTTVFEFENPVRSAIMGRDAGGGGRFLEKLRTAADDVRQSDAGDCFEVAWHGGFFDCSAEVGRSREDPEC
jgi:hypothetical protein